MKSLLAGLLLSWLACQEAVPQFVPGDATSSRWPLSGPAEADNETELNLRARRITRRWDAGRRLFAESLSESIQRNFVVASSRRFEGSLKASTPGRYGVTLSTDEKVLHSEKLALGLIEPMFARGPDDIKAILEIVDKAGEFLDEIERILTRQIDNSDKHREDYLKRVSEQVRKLEELLDLTDLSGTVLAIREVYFHIRNVQVWEEKNLPPAGNNDPPRNKKKLFTDMDLTIEGLRKTLASVGAIMSHEIKVSTTLILERLLAQAGEVERRKDAARAAARASSKMAEAAPGVDKDLVRLLDFTADRSSNPTETRVQLRAMGQSLLVQ